MKRRWTPDRSRAKPTRCRGRRSLTEALAASSCARRHCGPHARRRSARTAQHREAAQDVHDPDESTRTAASRRGPDRHGRTSDTTGVAVALSADSGNCPWPMLAAPGGPRRRLPGGVGRQHGRGRWRAGGGAGPPGRRRPTRWQRRPRRPPDGAGGRGGGAAGPSAGRGGHCGRRLRRGLAGRPGRRRCCAAWATPSRPLRAPPAARPTRRRRPTPPPPPRRPIRESAMAGRTPPGLRGWWRYSRLVGWRVTVRLTSSPP